MPMKGQSFVAMILVYFNPGSVSLSLILLCIAAVFQMLKDKQYF